MGKELPTGTLTFLFTDIEGSTQLLHALGPSAYADALLYWLIDSGGPFARARGARPLDFAFVQHLSPEVAPKGWRPVFLDYLHLGFTNATAFSPTDVMPLSHRAKYAMVVQSTVALALFGLIVARAVNAFT
jgi:class 3 adenylate cyclase